MNNKYRNDNDTKIARAYIRVSFQGERGKVPGRGEFLSPELQIDAARDYVKLHLPGYVFDEEGSRQHIDIDRSASRLKWQKREGMVALLEAAKRGELDALVVFKLSRFARNVREGLDLFDQFEKAGCSVHCIKDNLDTITPAGKMITTILLAVAEMEVENISDWVSESHLKRARDGKMHAQAVFWLSRDGNDGYELNENAAVMRRMVDLRLQGFSNAKVSRTINEEGFTSPKGRPWTSDRIRLYLKPDKLKLLCGHYVYGLGKADDDPRRVIQQNAVPAVITEDEAEAILATNRRMAEMYDRNNPKRAAGTSYVLSGVIWCAYCGDRMKSRTTKPAGKPSKSGYMCKYASSKDIPHPLGAFVSGEALEDAVFRVIHEAVLDYREVLKEGIPVKRSVPAKETGLEKKIEKCIEKISRLFDLYHNGHMNLEDYDRQYKALDAERERMRERLKQDDSETAMRMAAAQAVTGDTSQGLTKEQARRLVLAFIERVDAPVKIEGPMVSESRKRSCRGTWVTLRLPLRDGTRRILAPIYDPRYTGERVLLERE